MRHLSIRVNAEAVSSDVAVRSKGETFAHLARMAVGSYGLDGKLVASGLREREALGSTGFGASIAIPHAKIAGLEQCVGLFLRLTEPISFDAHDGKPGIWFLGCCRQSKAGPITSKPWRKSRGSCATTAWSQNYAARTEKMRFMFCSLVSASKERHKSRICRVIVKRPRNQSMIRAARRSISGRLNGFMTKHRSIRYLIRSSA